VALGGIAVWNMRSVTVDSEKLAKEYAPEVEVANDIERNSLKTMYAMRGYFFTEGTAFWDTGVKSLADVKKSIGEAKDLAEKSPHLVKLKGAVGDAETKVLEYEKIANEGKVLIAKIDEVKKKMGEESTSYMKNCNDFLESQNQAFKTDLASRQKKVEIVTDIVGIGTKTRVLNFKAQATGDMALMAEAVTNLNRVFEKTKELRPLTKDAVDIAHIDETEAAARGYAENMQAFLSAQKDLGTLRGQMDEAAAAYMKNCNTFLAGQNEKMRQEFGKDGANLEERLNKITLVNDIIDLGNAARILNFKAQATGDMVHMHEALKVLDGVDQKTAALRKITREEEDIRRIEETEAAGKTYRAAIQAFLKQEAHLAEYQHKMDENAGKYVANCDAFLQGQQAKLAHDMNERHDKITLVNDIIDLGNDTRVRAFKSQALRDPAIIDEATKNFPQMDAKFEALRKLTRQEANLKQIDNTKAAAAGYLAGMTAFLKNWKEAQVVGTQRGEAGQVVIEACKKTAEAGMEHTDRIANNAATSLSQSSSIMVGGLIVAAVLGVGLAIFITIGITGPVNRIIAGLRGGAEQVSSASGQVASSSQQMAEGASEQASSLEEISSSLEEMASMTRQNADNAKQANTMATDAQNAATKGMDAMTNMSSAINRIKTSSDETAKIIKTIDEIAFQTNLLALNAAVEAARAGDAGKGFAVVAEEVRNLAQRSAEAAKNTSALIEESQKNAENGVTVTADVAEILGKITETVQKVTQLIGEVTAASNEQAQGIDQVNTAVSQMDKVTQSNAANAEESASASEEMSSQAAELNSMVDVLVSIVHGAKGANGGAAQRSEARAHLGAPAGGHGLKTRARGLLHHEEKRGGTNRMAAVASSVVKPDAVIPLDDEEMKDF